MTAKATKLFEPLLVAMNNIGNGVSLPHNNYVQTQQTADLSDAFSKAVSNVHPRVSVVDINDGIKRVNVIDNLETI